MSTQGPGFRVTVEDLATGEAQARITPDGTAERPGDWCTCGHARDEHGETGTCLGNHRIENPDFFPGEAFIDDAECYCQHFEFWYASGSQP